MNSTAHSHRLTSYDGSPSSSHAIGVAVIMLVVSVSYTIVAHRRIRNCFFPYTGNQQQTRRAFSNYEKNRYNPEIIYSISYVDRLASLSSWDLGCSNYPTQLLKLLSLV